MSVEKKFIKSGLEKAQMSEFFIKHLDRAGYGGMEINRTPIGTQITIYAEKPGIIIGKGGKTIHKLTRDLESIFDIENPQIEVKEVEVPELNAQMMASRLAGAIERGLYFRKAGHNMLRRIMDTGALGCEIDISGKLTGPRNRTEKFVAGNMLHAGDPAYKLVNIGFAVAIKKLGTIGCRVRIVPPDIKLPGKFSLLKEEIKPSPETEEKKQEGIEEIIEKEEDKTLESMVETTTQDTQEEIETITQDTQEEIETTTQDTQEEIETTTQDTQEEVETTTQEIQEEIEERTNEDGIIEHKHQSHNYWHPASRIHKKEEK